MHIYTGSKRRDRPAIMNDEAMRKLEQEVEMINELIGLKEVKENVMEGITHQYYILLYGSLLIF